MEFAIWFYANWLQDPPTWTQIAVAALGVVASTAVGIFAAVNGYTARQIASDAALRDQIHRASEEQRQTDETRSQVALAMIRAINAVISTSAKPRKHKNADGTDSELSNPLRDAARVEEDTRVAEAKALISLLLPDSSPVNARDWFSHMVEHFRGLTTPERDKSFKTRRDELFVLIAKWNKDESYLAEMLALDFEGDLGRDDKLGVCDGNHFRLKVDLV